ncbi:hypothetical protein [Acidisoma sp.]|uniref:hypothetical protein n=1 Tax=Acidisoma sp. TaxID=1872115 RepID=UPI003B00C264
MCVLTLIDCVFYRLRFRQYFIVPWGPQRSALRESQPRLRAGWKARMKRGWHDRAFSSAASATARRSQNRLTRDLQFSNYLGVIESFGINAPLAPGAG